MKLLAIISFAAVITIISGNEGKDFIADLRYRNGSGMSRLTTLVLVRPRFLLGYKNKSVTEKLGIDEFENSTMSITNSSHFDVHYNSQSMKIKGIYVPGVETIYVCMMVFVVELEYYEWEKMLSHPSLEFVRHDMKAKCTEMYSLTYENSIKDFEMTKHTLADESNCVIGSDPQYICSASTVKKVREGPLFCVMGDDPFVKFVGFQSKEHSTSSGTAWILVHNIKDRHEFLTVYLEDKNEDLFKFAFIGFLLDKGKKLNYCIVTVYNEKWVIGCLDDCDTGKDYNTDCPNDDTTEPLEVLIFNTKRDDPIRMNVRQIKYLHNYNDRFETHLVLIELENKLPLDNKKYVNAPIGDYDPKEGLSYINDFDYTSCYHIYASLKEAQPFYEYRVVKFMGGGIPGKIIYGTTVIGNRKRVGVASCNRARNNRHELVGFEVNIESTDRLAVAPMAGNTSEIERIINTDSAVDIPFPKDAIGVLSDGQNECTVAVIDKSWLAGSMDHCKLQNLLAQLSKVTPDYDKWNVTVTGQQRAVERIFFSEKEVKNNRLVLIKVVNDFDIKTNIVIPDYVTCRKLASMSINKQGDLTGETHELNDNKNACDVENVQLWSLEDRYVCTTRLGVNGTASSKEAPGPLFEHYFNTYRLIGVPQNERDNNALWFLIGPYKLWISDVMNKPDYKPSDIEGSDLSVGIAGEDKPSGDGGGSFDISPDPTMDDNRTAETQLINFGAPVDFPSNMVRITVNTPRKQVCHGFLFARNWVVTTIGCNFAIRPTSSEDTSVHALEYPTAVEILTNTADICLASHASFAQFGNGSHVEDTLSETYVFIKLLWPVNLGKDVTTIKIVPKIDHSSSSSCSVVHHTQSDPAFKFNYTGRPDALRSVPVPIVETFSCAEYHKTLSDIPWTYGYCTKTSNDTKEVFFSDPSSALICNGYLAGMFMKRWQNPDGTVNARLEGEHVPVGWLRVDAFAQQINAYITEDRSFLKKIKYGKKADWSKWKFLASVQYKGHHVLTAALITPYFLLTSTKYSTNELTRSCRNLVAVFSKFDLNDYKDTDHSYGLQEARRVKNTSLAVLRLSGQVNHVPVVKFFHDKTLAKPNCVAAGWPKESITRWYHANLFTKNNYLREEWFKVGTKPTTPTFRAQSVNGYNLADDGFALMCNNQLLGMNFANEDGSMGEWVHVPWLTSDITSTVEKTKEELGLMSPPNDWEKYLAVITLDDLYECAGTLIHPRWVLTAAICVEKEDVTSIGVIFGVHNMKMKHSGEKYTVADYKIVDESDMALIMLSRAVPRDSDNYRTLDLVNPYYQRYCTIFTAPVNEVAGWPRPEPMKAQFLQSARVRTSECQLGYIKHEFQKQYVCVTAPDEKTTYSFLRYPGGPLVCRQKDGSYRLQIGVNIWGSVDSWVSNSTTAFSLIFAYFHEINKIITINIPDGTDLTASGNTLDYYEERFIYDTCTVRLHSKLVILLLLFFLRL